MDPHRYNRHSMFLRKDVKVNETRFEAFACCFPFFLAYPLSSTLLPLSIIEPQTEEDVGLLVQVSFYITAFTLPAYQRGSLPRPSKDDSS